ncbi:hypothetical protein D621_21085 [beta proteobacterium AAP51]|nr:hypothetical protein D621_21085 [beta proteobacterium AAP51]
MNHPPYPAVPGHGLSDEDLAAALHASRVMHDAPEALVQRALGLWSRQAPAPQPAGALAQGAAQLRRLVAKLAFDSLGLTPQAAGLRGSVGMAPRQLLYTAEGCDVDLRFTAAEDGMHWVVSGQVLGPDLAGHALLQPAAPGAPAQERAWNDLAEFHFAPVAAGPCTLVLRSADWQLELPLQLPPAAPGGAYAAP